MPEYKQIRHERLYVKVPGSDRLRKGAAGRIKHLTGAGWRETERVQHPDHIVVRFERTGHAPMKARLPKGAPEVRIERRPRGGFGGGRFGSGGRGGSRGGPRGGGRGPSGPSRGPAPQTTTPTQAPPASAPAQAPPASPPAETPASPPQATS